MSSRLRDPAPHRRILDLVRAVPAVDRQNRLIRATDRDLALSLLYMNPDERERVLRLVGRGKADRVSAELARFKHTRIDYRQYEIATAAIIRCLEGSTAQTPRSYYRPRRARSR